MSAFRNTTVSNFHARLTYILTKAVLKECTPQEKLAMKCVYFNAFVLDFQTSEIGIASIHRLMVY